MGEDSQSRDEGDVNVKIRLRQYAKSSKDVERVFIDFAANSKQKGCLCAFRAKLTTREQGAPNNFF